MSRFGRLTQLRGLGVALFWIVMLFACTYVLLTAVDIAGNLFNEARVSDGERLNFLGALLGSALGAALAIGGALFVEEARRGQQEKASRTVIREVLDELQISLEEAAKPLDGGRAINEQKMPIIHALERFETAFDLLRTLRKEMKITDVKLWQKLRTVETNLSEQKSTLESERGILERHNVTAAVLNVAHDKVSRAADLLSPLIKVATSHLKK